jgi:hypothetical protein
MHKLLTLEFLLLSSDVAFLRSSSMRTTGLRWTAEGFEGCSSVSVWRLLLNFRDS